MQVEEQYRQHNHDGLNTKKIKPWSVIPSYLMAATELSSFTASEATDGDMFTNFDGTNYKIYVRMNGAWKSAALT